LPFLVLGAGFTGSRVAAILQSQGHQVLSLRRAQIDFTHPEAASKLHELTPSDAIVLHSIPSLPLHADATLLSGLEGKAQRVVYLSTTGVYGDQEFINEQSLINPSSDRELQRAMTEAAVAAGPWSSLILRPAAIYGPHRGVHVSMSQGKYTLLGDGSNFISRIHVDDLARLATAALLSDLTGAYPVADESPCPSREIAEYCSELLHLPPPVPSNPDAVPPSRSSNRRVDARAIFRLLGLTLQYPSYREGLAQCLAAERGQSL
jgi:nucleoside-diphosphate-sugar epimerase